MNKAVRSDFQNLWKTMNLGQIQRDGLPMTETIVAPFTDARERPAREDDLRLLSTIGEGGMGIVRLAEQPALFRHVAVKTVRPENSAPADVERLLCEARVTGLLEHPHIVPVYALTRGADGLPQMVMKRIEGTEWAGVLSDPMAAPAPGLPEDALGFHIEVLMQVASAVHYAHSKGIVHLDIKPENVMLGHFQEVYLVDWGIAMALEDRFDGYLPLAAASKTLVGSPAYLAPEMLGGELSVRTDVYLLGATLHEVISGDPPHLGGNLQATLYSAFQSLPRRYGDDVPVELAAIACRAMHRDPEQRFASVEAFRWALEEFLRHRGSIELAHQAGTQAAQLQHLLAGAASAEEEETQRLFGECRFGFRAALSDWPENPQALAGLQQVVESMIAHELDAGREERAAVLLAELPRRRPDLASRVEAQRLARVNQAKDLLHLTALSQDVDLSVGRGVRSRVALLIGVIWAVPPLLTFVFERLGWFRIGYPGTAVACISFVVAACWVVYARRETLFKNTVNQRISLAVILSAVFLLLLRVVGWLAGWPLATVFLMDIFLCLALLTMIVVAHDLRLLWGGIPWLLALFLSVASPKWLYVFEGLAIFFSFGIVGWIWRMDEQRTTRAAVSPPR